MNLKFINVSNKKVEYGLRKDGESEFLSYTLEGALREKARYNQLAYDLIDLYNNSSKHNAIVTSKINYITAGGLVSENADLLTNEFLTRPNAVESGNEILEKLSTDLELQGGYYLQLVFGKVGGKLIDVYHVPFEKMQTNKQGTKFRYIEDVKKPNEFTLYDVYTGINEGTKIHYISKYRAGSGVVPLPEYYASLKYIQIDKEIANFNLNNIRSGFSAGTMVVLFNGEPTPEEEESIHDQIKNNTTGTDAAGSLWLYFAKSGEERPQVIPLNGNDLVERFAQLNDQCRDEIFIGHKVVSPMLFGVRVEGSLGGRSEMNDSFELLNNSYIIPNQNILQSSLNFCNRLKGGLTTITIKPSKPLGVDLLEMYREGIITDRTIIQKEYGLPISTTELRSDGRERDNDWTHFLEFGEAAENWEVIEDLPVELNANNIPVAFDKVTDEILQAIIDNPLIDIPTLINRLNIDAEEAAKRIKTMIADNLIIAGKGLEITTAGKKAIGSVPTSEFFVKYRYDGPKDDKNRAFCAKLLQLNRVYTREDIESLSSRLEYNVWMRRGGWYNNLKAGVNTPYCRHTWRQVIVKRKL